jgi:hypothetical protein
MYLQWALTTLQPAQTIGCICRMVCAERASTQHAIIGCFMLIVILPTVLQIAGILVLQGRVSPATTAALSWITPVTKPCN